MSVRPSRRSVNVVPKVKLGERQPLPEPAEEMGVVEVKSAVPYYDRLSDQPVKAEMHGAVNMLSSLRLDGTSGYTTPSLSGDGSFDDDFVFDSEDDFGQGRCWQLSGDTGSSGFGNSVASFMSWTDDVEVETTKKVQELVDQLERCLYGEESLDVLKKQVAEECSDWRNKFPHFRVKGTGIPASSFQQQRLYKNTLEDTVLPSEGAATCVVLEDDEDAGEEEEEVIASHGSYQEEPELHDTCNAVLSSRPDTAESVDTVKYDGDLDTVKYDRDLAEENLKQKVKDAVMEQLFSYVWSEVSKNLEPLFRTLYSRPDSRPSSSQGPNSRRASPKLPPAVDTSRAFTPISDIRGSDLDSALHASKRSVRRSARKTSVPPSLEPSYEVDESVDSYFITDPARHSAAPPIVRLPQPLSLHSANQVLAPMPTSELRGYHSAADRRTRTVLNRRFSSVTSGHERFLKPLEEQQMVAVKSTATPRQASAPSSPPNWSRHVTLPPIEQLDTSFKVLSSSKRRSTEDNCTNSTSAKQKLHDLCSKMRSVEVSPRINTSAKQKISLTPIGGSAPIRVQGTSLSNLELAKQLLEKHEDLIFESNGLTPTADDKIFKQKSRVITRRK